jgi:5-methylcytosine-specific restriction protein A
VRREFPAKVKLAAYERSLRDGKPHCEACGLRIVGLPEYDHVKPDGLGGEPTLENCQCLCGKCHRIKTHEEDGPIMRKADNQRKSAANIKRKYPWPKRKMQ